MKSKRHPVPSAQATKKTAQKLQSNKRSATNLPPIEQPTPATASKQQRCLDLLGRRDGANMSELVAATSWQNHSVRGFLSATVKKKLGLALVSTQGEDGARRYRIERTSRGR